ncbi:MAG TPA: response regulator [Candidatus Acidoferrales bacterium]|jgi:DNA-binding response OmpR family regulator|nr:response regulator [Candidatus Acidoferrales bacterium]
MEWAKSPRETATILLLSSEPLVLTILTEALRHAGYVVSATGSFGSAVDLLADGGIDLLIVRPHVDSISGYEAAKYLHARNPDMAVLIVAGLPDDNRIQYRDDLEGFKRFPPPFTTAQLLDKVDEVLKAVKERGTAA